MHDRAKASDAEAQGALSKVQKLESAVQNGGKEVHLLQSQLDQVDKDKNCLLAAVALLSGMLFPQIDKISALVNSIDRDRLAEKRTSDQKPEEEEIRIFSIESPFS